MRRAIALAWVCLGASLGCEPEPSTVESTPEAVEPEPEPTMPPIGVSVVIDEQRGLFETPNVDARRIVTGAEPRLRIVEVVAITGEFIEVRMIADERGDVCSRVVVPHPIYELRFFVELEALQQVLTNAVGENREDGTRLTLLPGVPVIEVGMYGKVQLGSVSLEMDVYTWDVGRWFESNLAFTWKSSQALHYVEHDFAASESDPLLAARDRNAIDGVKLRTYVNACGRLLLHTDLPDPPGLPHEGSYWGGNDEDVLPDLAHAGTVALGRFLADDGCSTVQKAAAGTELSWPKGGTAGVVLAPHQLPREAEKRDDRVCFDVSGFTVCIAADMLEPELVGDCDLFPYVRDLPKRGIRVRPTGVEIGEDLDPDIVQKIVQRRIGEVRRCYAGGLARDPSLAGRVVIAFEVDATGTRSRVQSTTLEPADDVVTTCIYQAIKGWNFPEPRDDKTVSVVYPLDLSP